LENVWDVQDRCTDHVRDRGILLKTVGKILFLYVFENKIKFFVELFKSFIKISNFTNLVFGIF